MRGSGEVEEGVATALCRKACFGVMSLSEPRREVGDDWQQDQRTSLDLR